MRQNKSNKNFLAVFGLLFGALGWGVIWYPYRVMSDAGVSGVASSFYTYSIAALIGCVLFAKNWRGVFKLPKSAILLALAAGWTNLSYVLAVIDGEVMRVMLLFYLSPLWTLLLARFWLKEHISREGFIAIGIAMLGAYIMLADPFGGNMHWPVPQNKAEWLALSAGIGFALTNVITRKSAHLSIAAKSMLVWLGVVAMAIIFKLFLGAFFSNFNFPGPSFFNQTNWLVMGFIALFLMTATILVQYGVTQIEATRASVLFLFELVVAAIAAYFLANEAMTVNEYIGGIFIIVAALFAGFNH